MYYYQPIQKQYSTTLKSLAKTLCVLGYTYIYSNTLNS